MKISLNWLKRYVDIDIPNDDLVRLIGARLVEVEGVIDETHKYDNIYVVEVVKAEKIPDTHLTLCQINTGAKELVQVVCGAPNVKEGMLAAWIAPGAVVPASVHEDAPFVIGKRKMLNKYDSNGMLAAADELDFGTDHEGIIEINPADAKAGDLLADVYDLRDWILEIENKSLTHRPDCFGLIGFAREVAGILGEKFEDPKFLWEESVFEDDFVEIVDGMVRKKDTKIKIEIADKKLCPRYTCALVKINEATAKNKYFSIIDIWLAKSGMHSISKIVDVTNYLMLLTGQPLHAFDYDKFLKVGGTNEAKIIVRAAREGEKLRLLDDTEIECTDNDILITSNNVPVAMAGAMGGENTEIDENTKNVLIESATFSLYNLRKTQMAHGIFSEAITRFTKGVPAGGTYNVLAEAVDMMNAKPLDLNDAWPGFKTPDVVKITTDEINLLLGTNYDRELIVKTLTNVGFWKSDNSSVDTLQIGVPFWRTDIAIPEDIIEEVGRLLGYDNIEPIVPLHQTAERNNLFVSRRKIRELFASLGASEVLTYSFVSEKLLKKVGQDPKNSYKIVNSISPELQYVRQSIIPNLLEKTFVNEKLPVDRFAIFEMNQVYRKEWGMNAEKVPAEQNQIGFVLAERKYNDKTAFYQAKKYVAKLLTEFNIEAEFVPMKHGGADAKPFEPKRSADILVDGEYIGVVGEFKNSVKAEFKLADYLAGFEINLDLMLAKKTDNYKIDLSKKEIRDLTVVTKKNYKEVTDKISEIVKKEGLEAKILPISVYKADISDDKHISVRLEFSKFDKAIMAKLENLQF